MAKPTNRETFKQYCLGKLGAPIIRIDLTDEQIDDRVDEAISFWKDYHFDGTELVYFKYQMTQTDVDNGFILMPPRYLGVVRIFDIASSFGDSNMFSAEYQFALNNMSQMSGSLSNYVASKQYTSLMSEVLNGLSMIRFNRLNNKLHIDISKSKMRVGSWIVVEAYDGIDEEENAEVWNDRWLQNYATVLIKENWGNVLTKFQNGQLIGGLMFNGDQILAEAKDERRKLEEEVTKNFGPAMHYFMG